MKIRFATLDDVPAFVEAGKQLHSMTRFRDMPYLEHRVAETLRGIIRQSAGTHCFIVAVDDNNAPAGWLIGCMERHFFSDQPIASVINYGVLPEKRMSGAGLRLLTAFRKWAGNRGAIELNAGVNSGVELGKMNRFLQRLGFMPTGGNYSLSLTAPSVSMPSVAPSAVS